MNEEEENWDGLHAGQALLDDVTRFYEDTLDMKDPTRAAVVVRRYFSRFANGGTPDDRIALLHILNEVYKF